MVGMLSKPAANQSFTCSFVNTGVLKEIFGRIPDQDAGSKEQRAFNALVDYFVTYHTIEGSSKSHKEIISQHKAISSALLLSQLSEEECKALSKSMEKGIGKVSLPVGKRSRSTARYVPARHCESNVHLLTLLSRHLLLCRKNIASLLAGQGVQLIRRERFDPKVVTDMVQFLMRNIVPVSWGTRLVRKVLKENNERHDVTIPALQRAYPVIELYMLYKAECALVRTVGELS